MKLVLTTDANGSHFGLLDELKAEGIDVVPAFDEEAQRRELPDADGVYGWPAAELLATATRLRWLQSPSAGVERLWSLPNLQRSEVIVTNARGAHAPNMAEHAFAMILAFTRGILAAREFQKEHLWEARAARESCSELAGKTLGVIGYGNIARQASSRTSVYEPIVYIRVQVTVPSGSLSFFLNVGIGDIVAVHAGSWARGRGLEAT
jgi:phosphoglycerate dehydrogenase-like enzyme